MKNTLFLAILILTFKSISQNQHEEPHFFSANSKHLEFPKINDDVNVILHTGYSLVYEENCEQAKWVAYTLTKKETEGVEERGNKFIVDPFVHTGSATIADYSKSGFDRGHLAPAADMKWSETVMKESFFFSNMSPQVPSFNRGIWKKLEEKVRDWAVLYDSVLIVTGPILNNNLKKIGPNEVCVPDYYYKVIFDFKKDHSKAIGFIMPNKGSSEPLINFAKTIDEVEKATGLDFFFQFSDKFENELEAKFCRECWQW
jgi:endonuclease G